MKTIAALLVALAPSLAGAEQGYNPDYYKELINLGLSNEAHQYAVNWAGTGDAEAEIALARELIERDPKVAIEFACGNRSFDAFFRDKFVLQANLRLAGSETQPIRCK